MKLSTNFQAFNFILALQT